MSAAEERLLAQLGDLPVVAHAEVMEFVRKRGLSRRGVGWVDAHLLASALVGGATLWTVDAPLAAAAGDLRLAFVRA